MDSFSFKTTQGDILIYRSIFAPVKSNMFVIVSGENVVVIDPNENEELLEIVKRKKVFILLTHEHYDHTSGVNCLVSKTNANLYCQSECAKSIKNKKNNNPALIALVLAEMDKKDGGSRYKEFKANFIPYECKADYCFDTSFNLKVGNLEIKGFSIPGHSPGSSCYIVNDKIVFTGDSLIKDTPVITRFPESSMDDYIEKALPFLKSLPKDSVIMPGHNDPFLLSDICF